MFDKGKFNFPIKIRKREKECLYWLCQGKTAEETAMILGIAYSTVLSYIRNLKIRLGCNTLAEVICKVSHAGLMDVD